MRTAIHTSPTGKLTALNAPTFNTSVAVVNDTPVDDPNTVPG